LHFKVRYELQIALRYLRARRKDAFISITTIFTAIGVMLGVAALVIVLAVMGGFESSLRQRILSLTPQVEIQSSSGAIANYAAIEARADKLEGVAGSDPFIIGQAMVSSAHGISGVVVRGVEPQNATVMRQLRRYVLQGSLDRLANNAISTGSARLTTQTDGTVAIGTTLADKLKVKIDDPISVVAPITSANDSELTTRTGHLVVGAIFESGIAFVDRDLVFIGLSAAQKFFGRQDRVDGIEVRLTNLDKTDAVTAQLRAMFARSYRVSNWMEFNQAAAAGFQMLKRVYALVLLMLIGVAAFNLVATLIMVVMEKRKDVAVLMAMGATPTDVRRIFVLKGMIVGASGTAAGLALGALGCFLLAHYHFIHIEKKIYGISTLPIDAQPLSFAIVALASLMLCWIATVYPARQAAREMPVEVFRS
jgi:lipoprotein-releasing system permease protein